MPNTCVFTIVSKNYLHFARALMESVKAVAPDVARVVALCDRFDFYNPESEIFTVIPVEELNILQFEELTIRSTIVELNTAVKPFVFANLYSNNHYRKLIYFDPDILIYGSLEPMRALLDKYNILLTPHITEPVIGSTTPSELDIIQSGTYNLGFIALRCNERTLEFLDWWKAHLLTDCIIDKERGIFLDQKWIDLAPGMFEGVRVVRDPGWNVAYWNLRQRVVVQKNSCYFVNEKPLVFFHFSGFRPLDRVFSAHNNSYEFESLPTAVQTIIDDYRIRLQDHGADITRHYRYAFASRPDGVWLPDIVRQAYRRNKIYMQNIGPQHREFYAKLLAVLSEPANIAGRSNALISRIGHEIYLARPEIREAYPDLFANDAEGFAKWYVESVEREYQLPSELVTPVKQILEMQHDGKHRNIGSRVLTSLLNMMDRSDRLRRIVVKLTSKRVRHKLRFFLLKFDR